MLFNSIQFLIFLPIVLLLYYTIPHRVRYLWLLAASYYFYMCWNARYALLMLLSTAITYLSGLLLEAVKKKNWSCAKTTCCKKWIVAFSLLSNLSILFYYKYFNFVFDSLARGLNFLHIQFSAPTVDVLLPVGISFYTFQALSYTIDVYRSNIYAEKNFFRYALFVSFFPQLVAGPIERSKNILTQLAVPHRFSFSNLREGLLLMLWGFFLKIILADRIAIFVDAVYANPEVYSGWFLIVASLLFSVQIYCDFSGYSTIAMGSALMLDIRLTENFSAPYLSGSISEFWRRWHISLTSWFRDYLYIPLGGSRRGAVRKQLNKLIVFLVSGLWHGAQFTFVIWGFLNGIYQVIGELTAPLRIRLVQKLGIRTSCVWYKLWRILCTFLLIDFSWVFFRASSLSQAFLILRSMLTARNSSILFDGSLFSCGLDAHGFAVILIGILLLAIADFCKVQKIQVRQKILDRSLCFRCVFVSVSIALILLFGLWGPSFNGSNFIYFQF